MCEGLEICNIIHEKLGDVKNHLITHPPSTDGLPHVKIGNAKVKLFLVSVPFNTFSMFSLFHFDILNFSIYQNSKKVNLCFKKLNSNS